MGDVVLSGYWGRGVTLEGFKDLMQKLRTAKVLMPRSQDRLNFLKFERCKTPYSVCIHK